MNRLQRVALGCGLAVMLMAAICPPWREDNVARHANYAFSVDQSAGHGPLWSPPDPGGKQVRVDAGMLLAELALITSITGLVVVGLGAKANRD